MFTTASVKTQLSFALELLLEVAAKNVILKAADAAALAHLCREAWTGTGFVARTDGSALDFLFVVYEHALKVGIKPTNKTAEAAAIYLGFME